MRNILFDEEKIVHQTGGGPDFQKNGIRHTSDASIAELEDGSISVVDFAVA
jgi:hypothetical protein